MLSKTTRLSPKESQYLCSQSQNQIAYYQILKEKLQAILEEMLREKKALQERILEERRGYSEQLEAKEERTEKLEVKVRQLQKENQQIRYQYEQRVALMNILKQQNWLISKQYAEEKERMKETLEHLVRENSSLKQAIVNIQRSAYQHHSFQPHVSARDFNSPKKFNNYVKPQQFYSMTDLKSDRREKCHKLKCKLQASKFNQSSENEASLLHDSCLENSISQSSMVQALKKRESEFKHSRITQVKGSNGKSKLCGLQRMSAITHLSREKTCGRRSDD